MECSILQSRLVSISRLVLDHSGQPTSGKNLSSGSEGSVFVSGQPTSVLKNRPREKIRPRVVYVPSVNCPRLMST